MDVQTICLGLLSEADRSGYEIKKQLEEGPLGHFMEASFGSIYPALTRLTEEGLVEFRTEAQEGRPDKKTYSITKKGREAFKETLTHGLGPDRFRSDYLFALWFYDRMDPENVTEMLDLRIAELNAKIERIKAERGTDAPPGPDFVAGQALAIFEAAKNYLEQNRHRLESQGHEDFSAPTDHAVAGVK